LISAVSRPSLAKVFTTSIPDNVSWILPFTLALFFHRAHTRRPHSASIPPSDLEKERLDEHRDQSQLQIVATNQEDGAHKADQVLCHGQDSYGKEAS
jgi:hypothetical protein